MPQRHRKRILKVCLNILRICYPPHSRTHTHTLISPWSCDMWSGKKLQQRSGAQTPAFLLFCPLALLVIHSWAVLGGSYVNAWVCFWLGGTKSTLYKCTPKQLPLLLTAAPTQTSDCGAALLAYSGGKDGFGSFTTVCLSITHMSRDCETARYIVNK